MQDFLRRSMRFMVKTFSFIFLLFLWSLVLAGEETALRIADASRRGIGALNAAALPLALQEKISVSVDRVTPQEALERLKTGRADLIVLEHGNLPAKHPWMCRRLAAEVCAVYGHRENPLENVTRQDLAEVFKKHRPVWSILYPLKNTDIHRYSLKERAAGYRLAESLLGVEKMAPDIFTVASTRQMLLLMQENPEALGIGLWQPDARQVKIFSVNGVKPTIENISTGKYLLCWRYYLLGTKKCSQEAEKFLQLLQRQEFRKNLETFGFIPLASGKAADRENSTPQERYLRKREK